MFKKIISSFKNLEQKTHKIMKSGLQFSLGIGILASFLLFVYETSFTNPSLYHFGLTLFKLSLMFGIEFIICGIVVDSLKKQII